MNVKSGIAIAIGLFVCLSDASARYFKPGVVEKRYEAMIETNRAVFPYVVNTNEFVNKSQQTWLTRITTDISLATAPSGKSREEDAKIQESYQRMASIIPNLRPLGESKNRLRDQFASKYEHFEDRSAIPFFSAEQAVEKWICIIKEQGVCEILHFLPQASSILRTAIVERPKDHFTNTSRAFNPVNPENLASTPTFKSYFPGDILMFDGRVYGIEVETQGTNVWVMPTRIYFSGISKVEKIETKFKITKNDGSDLKVDVGRQSSSNAATTSADSSISQSFDPRLSDSKGLTRVGINDQRARFIVNAQQFINQEQREALSQLVRDVSILVQQGRQSRELDDARSRAFQSLSARIPPLMGQDEIKRGVGTKTFSIKDQLLEYRLARLPSPFFSSDQTATDWVCVITEPKGPCYMHFFDKNALRVFSTKVVLWDRTQAQQPSLDTRKERPFENLYPGDVISFSGKYFGFEFGNTNKYDKSYYPEEIFFSEVGTPKVIGKITGR